MNPKPMSETEAIRSDIEMTRRRMDETVDALGERMHGRHLVDEVIGFFRSSNHSTSESDSDIMHSETAGRVREKLSDAAGKISATAGNTANAVVDTVKNNPLPILLIVGGAAWLAYAATRGRNPDLEEDDMDDSNHYDPDTHFDRPIEYPPAGLAAAAAEGRSDEAGSKFQPVKDTLKDKVSGVSETARDKFQSVKESTAEFGSRIKDRASDLGSQVQDRAGAMYGKTRDVVVHTADEHPLALGLGCLALGVLVGLALPTPAPLNRVAGPTVDRLRHRTRDAGKQMLQKGRRVVQAATDAARHEAELQGLTLERSRHGAAAIGEQAGQAASNTAREEGLAGGAEPEQPRAGAEPAAPSVARSAM